MMKNLLSRTKCYLVGNIENSDAPDSWRNLIKRELKDTGIVFFDPLKKPFLDSTDEDKEHINRLMHLRENGHFDELSKVMRKIRVEDLSLVDRADFIIAVVSAKTASWGSAEEVFWANRMKKPIFLVIVEGKHACPFWIFGTIPHNQVYDNIDGVVRDLRAIHAGDKEIDLLRWKIFREEYR